MPEDSQLDNNLQTITAGEKALTAAHVALIKRTKMDGLIANGPKRGSIEIIAGDHTLYARCDLHRMIRPSVSFQL
jgi:hypothetical protein